MSAEFIRYKEPRALAGLAAKLPALFMPDEKTAERFFDLFTANIRNQPARAGHTRQAIAHTLSGHFTVGRAHAERALVHRLGNRQRIAVVAVARLNSPL